MKPLLCVRNLQTTFDVGGKTVRAVDAVSFDLFEGETLSVVGESGCGKTTIGKGILQLLRPTSGAVSLEGIDLIL